MDNDHSIFVDESVITKLALSYKFGRLDEHDNTYQVQKLIPKVTDKKLLRTIAEKAKGKYCRWLACMLLGGHFLEETGVNRCKCTLCGFQHHLNEQNGTCPRCSGKVHTIPFTTGYPHSNITFPDGTTEYIDGYDGVMGDSKEWSGKERQ
jgi:hypothetical protein